MICRSVALDTGAMTETKAFSRAHPSPRYQQLLAEYQAMHGVARPDETAQPGATMYVGNSLRRHLTQIRRLARTVGATSILDYGSGKGAQYLRQDFWIGMRRAKSVREYWGVDDVVCYDPAYLPFSTLPDRQFDGVVCTDVLENVPEDDVPWVLGEMFGFARKFLFANVASFPATAKLPSGENAHCTVRPPSWWADRITEARRAAGSDADYLVVVTEMRDRAPILGQKRKRARLHTNLTNQPAWS